MTSMVLGDSTLKLPNTKCECTFSCLPCFIAYHNIFFIIIVFFSFIYTPTPNSMKMGTYLGKLLVLMGCDVDGIELKFKFLGKFLELIDL